MHFSVKATAIVAALALSGPALADGMDNCTTEPESAWKTLDEVSAMAVEQGYEVRKIEKEGTCYEVYGLKDGKLWELFYNPVTGEVLEAEEKS